MRPFDTLRAIVWWQSLAGVLTCVVAFHLLVDRLGVRRRVAFIVACLLAVEPAQLYYERMVLAESVGLLAFVLFVASTAAYLATARRRWIPVAVLFGLAAISLRLNYAPVVLVISVVAPLLRWLNGEHRPPVRRVLADTAIALACVVVMHGTFQLWVSLIFSSPPGYIARAGFMQLGLVIPLVTNEHLVAVGLPPDFAEHLQYPLHDPNARMRHMWSPGGFVRALRDRHIPVEPVARPLVRMALADDPLGLIRLGWHTLGEYFREDGITHALENDLGRRVIPEEILWTLREEWHYDAAGIWAKTTPVSWYFERGTWGLVVSLLLLLPLSVVSVWVLWSTPYRVQALLAGLLGVGLVLAHFLFVPVALYRYMHPLPFFVALTAVPVACRLRPMKSLTPETAEPRTLKPEA